MKQKNENPKERRKRTSAIIPRLLLSLGAFFIALAVAEIAFRILDWPHLPKPHEQSVRFAFAKAPDTGESFYVNHPGRITFRYDGNPRSYFDQHSEVHHDVNPTGFRGPAFIQKPQGALRLVCLGDSFTFGEGVRNEDVYAEVTARQLRSKGRQVDACNLGVGGYNTTQSLDALKRFGFDLKPDVVVLGYTLNDAELPLFQMDPATGQPVRRDREMSIESEADPQQPPTSGIYNLHLAKAFWMARHQRKLTQQTIDYYRSVNDPKSEGWLESERALREMIRLCREQNIPCIVVMFPLLFELSDDYPFRDIHQRVGDVVTKSGGRFIDLLPALAGREARDLIVHPTDQHPNEQVHAITGELLSEAVNQLSSQPDEH